MFDEYLTLYITPMIEGWEIKWTLVDNGSIINVCSHKLLNQIKEEGIHIPPLDEATFWIRAYDSSSKKPLRIATVLITTRVRKITTKFQVVDSKFSYNLFLVRPWLHDMDVVPSIVHGRLKFEYQGEVHIVLGDPKQYASCNLADFEDFSMTCPWYKIEPLEQPILGENTKNQTQIIEIGMDKYIIENVDLFTSIKDLGWSKILVVEGYQQHAILPEHYQHHENDEIKSSSCSNTSVTSALCTLMDNNKVMNMSTLYIYSFIHNYMVNKCKY